MTDDDDRDDRLAMVERITPAFDAHDLDAIVAEFSDDAVFETPRGAEP